MNVIKVKVSFSSGILRIFASRLPNGTDLTVSWTWEPAIFDLSDSTVPLDGLDPKRALQAHLADLLRGANLPDEVTALAGLARVSKELANTKVEE